MNFCEHGLYQENCPHCRMSNGIKPPIQLVKRAPRELPMAFPRQEQFLDRNGLTEKPIFEPSQNLSLLPKKLVRNFDLTQETNSSNSTLFENKRTELESIKVKLQNVKKQFLEE